MSKTEKNRTGLDIVTEMLNITKRMANKSRDIDVLERLIDSRGKLMDEYDKLKESSPKAAAEIEKDKAEISSMISEMQELDKGVNSAIAAMRAEAKNELEGSVSNQKALSYTKNTLSSSGSYLDIKK